MSSRIKGKYGLAGFWIIVTVVSLLIAALVFFAFSRLHVKAPIKIGVIVSLSGSGGNLAGLRDGLLLAVREVNTKGGINGRKIELLIEDSKSDPMEAVKTFRRIEARHHPALMISTLSSVSTALAPLAEEKEAPLMALVASAKNIAENRKWVFRYFTNTEHEVKPIISILKRLKVTSLGVMYQDDEYGRSAFEVMKAKFTALPGFVQGEPFKYGDASLRQKVLRLKNNQAIYVVGFAREMPAVVKTLREEKYKGHILAASGYTSESERKSPEADGIYVAAAIVFKENYPLANEIKSKIKSLGSNRPFDHFFALGHDFIYLLTGLLEGKEVSRENIRKTLDEGFVYPSIFGNINVQPGDHDFDYPMYPARIVNGNLEFER